MKTINSKAINSIIGAAAICATLATSAAAWSPFAPQPKPQPQPRVVRPVRPPRPRPPHPPFDIRVEPKAVNLYVFAPTATNGFYCVEISEDLENWEPCTNMVNGARCYFRVTHYYNQLMSQGVSRVIVKRDESDESDEGEVAE